MSEIGTLKKKFKGLIQKINTLRHKKTNTTNSGKRIQYESQIEELDEQI